MSQTTGNPDEPRTVTFEDPDYLPPGVFILKIWPSGSCSLEHKYVGNEGYEVSGLPVLGSGPEA